ncbi:DUF485 domain-containing protein [Amycolatopsis australiensis]|uniref:Uncharacterized membrane protein, DUF485 family n=1 Tax=Amycolatopsis australiensis TaxID=546364 RepID=A0A1K1T161_9PSEU|nr:DUF485 domain-containing protein [Amycolatopsis australiensis]SFW89813.1 Uncharacterized membrane protein, DUF485 family [Amycolatopsis australiensis]
MYDVARPAAGSPQEQTGQMPALFAGDRPPGAQHRRPAPPSGPDYPGIQASPEFTALRRRFRAFVFPMSLAFFAWYMTYVLLAAYAHDFMSHKVFGEVNVGILLGVGQFASTALVTWLYLRYARRQVDPRVAELRARAGLPEGNRR